MTATQTDPKTTVPVGECDPGSTPAIGATDQDAARVAESQSQVIGPPGSSQETAPVRAEDMDLRAPWILRVPRLALRLVVFSILAGLVFYANYVAASGLVPWISALALSVAAFGLEVFSKLAERWIPGAEKGARRRLTLHEWQDFARFQRRRLQQTPPFLLLEIDPLAPGEGARRRGRPASSDPSDPDVRDARLIDIPVKPQAPPFLDSVRRRLAGCLGLRLKPFRGRRRPLLHQVVVSRLHDDRNHWLLRGEGGSGKSVALHRLAHRLLDRVTRTRFAWFTLPPIPLYVDLSAWSHGEGERPSPEDLRTLVVTQATTLAQIRQEGETDEGRGHQDVAMTQWLEQWFDHGRRHGWWVLILDGFDEIPALRAADNPHLEAAYYHAEFAAFAGCLPTVVASRPFPEVARPGWSVLEVQPLDPAAQAAIVDAWFPGRWGRPGRRVLAEFRAPEHRLEGLLPNPLYLAAICLYRRDQYQVPDSPRKAFDHFVNRRLAKYRSAAAWGDLSFESLKQCAARIALEVLRDEVEDRPRERRVLVGDLKQDGWGALIDPDRAIELLHRLRLVRSLSTGEPQESRVLFLHQRILEHFAIEALSTWPDAVASKLLLGSATWREVAVGLLEEPDSEAARRLHDAIRGEATRWDRELSVPPRPVGGGAGDEPLGFPWPDGAQDVLGILHAAAERRTSGDSDYAPRIDRILAAAYSEGQESDRATVLGLSRAGSVAQRCDLLAQAFDSGRFALATLAYEQTLTLPPHPPRGSRISCHGCARWSSPAGH